MIPESNDTLGWPIDTPVTIRVGALGWRQGVVIGHHHGRVRVRYRDGRDRLRYTAVTPEALARDNPEKSPATVL